MTKKRGGDGPVIVKKYANRRLYNTETSSYVTLDHLAAMTREGRDFKVVDARTEEDITRSVLTQIIMEEEGRGETMLPVGFLRQLIAMYGDSMQSVVPGYLEASMEGFRRNQEQFRHAVEGAFTGSPFEALAKRNMAMLEAATEAFRPRRTADGSSPGGAAASTPGGPAASSPGGPAASSDVAELRAELARLTERIEQLNR